MKRGTRYPLSSKDTCPSAQSKTRSLQTLPVKSHMANIVGVVGHVVSAARTQPWHCRRSHRRLYVTSEQGCVPTNLYWLMGAETQSSYNFHVTQHRIFIWRFTTLKTRFLIYKMGMRTSVLYVLRIRYLNRENSKWLLADLLPGGTSCLILIMTLIMTMTITTNLQEYLFSTNKLCQCYMLVTAFYLISYAIDFKMHHCWMCYQERKSCQLTWHNLDVRCILIHKCECMCVWVSGCILEPMKFIFSFQSTTVLGQVLPST